MLEKCASFTCCLHAKSQEMKFCGPGQLKNLASWTRWPSERSGTWRLSDDGNVVKRSCWGCDDTNKKCRLLMERFAFEYQLWLGCRLLLQVQFKSKVAFTCQIFVSCKRCIFGRGGSTLKSEHCTVYLHFHELMSFDSTLQILRAKALKTDRLPDPAFRKWNLVCFNLIVALDCKVFGF